MGHVISAIGRVSINCLYLEVRIQESLALRLKARLSAISFSGQQCLSAPAVCYSPPSSSGLLLNLYEPLDRSYICIRHHSHAHLCRQFSRLPQREEREPSAAASAGQQQPSSVADASSERDALGKLSVNSNCRSLCASRSPRTTTTLSCAITQQTSCEVVHRHADI